MQRQRLAGDEDARRAGAVKQASGKKEEARVTGGDPQCVEQHDHALEEEARDERAPSAEPVGHCPEERTRHHARGAVGGEDRSDEGERQPRAEPHDRQDREGDTTSDAREEDTRG